MRQHEARAQSYTGTPRMGSADLEPVVRVQGGPFGDIDKHSSRREISGLLYCINAPPPHPPYCPLGILQEVSYAEFQITSKRLWRRKLFVKATGDTNPKWGWGRKLYLKKGMMKIRRKKGKRVINSGHFVKSYETAVTTPPPPPHERNLNDLLKKRRKKKS